MNGILGFVEILAEDPDLGSITSKQLNTSKAVQQP